MRQKMEDAKVRVDIMLKPSIIKKINKSRGEMSFSGFIGSVLEENFHSNK